MAMLKWKEQKNQNVDALLRYNREKAAMIRLKRADENHRTMFAPTDLLARPKTPDSPPPYAVPPAPEKKEDAEASKDDAEGEYPKRCTFSSTCG